MERLRRILLSKKKTPSDLAKKSGVEMRRIDEILAGAEATMAELRAFASALRVQVTEFLEPVENAEPVRMLFRHGFYRQEPPSADAEEPVARAFTQALELLGTFAPPQRWFGAVPVVEESYKGAEELSLWLRAHYCDGDYIGPVQGLAELMEQTLGIPVIVGGGQIDGSSVVRRGWPMAYVAMRTFAPRMLFTLAHELGHLLVHHDLSREAAFVDEDIEQAAWGKSKAEKFVDAFAATLLVPSQGIGIAFQKIREILSIKPDAPVGDIEIVFLSRIFGVSFMVAASRCEAVELLPKGGGASLYEQVKKEYGNPELKADALGIPAREEIDFPSFSRILMDEATRGVAAGSVSIGRAAEILKTTVASVVTSNRPALH